MEIFKPDSIKTSTNSQQKRSVRPKNPGAPQLRLVENPATNPTDMQINQANADAYLNVRFNRNLHAVKDALTEQQIQPMMVRGFLEATKQEIIDQPEQAIPAQANTTADAVTVLLA